MKGKKIKFTHVAEEQKSSSTNFLNKISTVSENSGHDKTEYQDPGKIIEPKNSKNSMNFLHLNIFSLPYHFFFESHTLLSTTKVNFHIIGIFESRIKQHKNPADKINLKNYSRKYCITKAANGSVLSYIKDDILYKLRQDIKIYKIKYPESTFLEEINQSDKNSIVCCIYRHPCMGLSEFDNDYLNSLSEKLLREKNKHIILLGDFNVDFLKYTKD